MEQFTVITPQGSIQVNLITGYAIGETPAQYENAEFDTLELISTLKGRLPSIPVPLTAISVRYPDGSNVSREMASTVRYKEAIWEPKETPDINPDKVNVSPSETEIVKEMQALMHRAAENGISMAGIMFKKKADKEGFMVPFMGFPKASQANEIVEDMAKSIHAMLHVEGEAHDKMNAICRIFMDGFKQHALCVLLGDNLNNS